MPLTASQCWAQVCSEFDSERLELLMLMGNCNKETDPKWLRKVKFKWRHKVPGDDGQLGFRDRVDAYCDKLGLAGGAIRYLDSIYQDSRWRNFKKLCERAYLKTTAGKRVKKKINQKYNATHPRVLTPAQKEARNARDRLRRADQRIARNVLDDV